MSYLKNLQVNEQVEKFPIRHILRKRVEKNPYWNFSGCHFFQQPRKSMSYLFLCFNLMNVNRKY